MKFSFIHDNRRRFALLGRVLVWLALAIGHLWAMLALFIDSSSRTQLALLLVILYGALIFAAARFLKKSHWQWPVQLLLVLAVFVWWLTIPARNDRNWAPEVAELATGNVTGNLLTVRNVRNFNYHTTTDFDARWETRTYDLNAITAVNLYICYWGPALIAHTIACWEFRDGSPLAISIETRKEVGERYSALLGFFRQYELIYIVADELDLIRLRTNIRGEQVYLYHFKWPGENARKLILDYFASINQLADQPAWYNALSHNCTTTIRHHALHIGAGSRWNWRILVNGKLDELAYQRVAIVNPPPFEQIRSQFNITPRALACNDLTSFSRAIRVGLPGI